jgi:hypothetical protein
MQDELLDPAGGRRRAACAIVLAWLAGAVTPALAAPEATPDPARLRHHVEYLADDALEGRGVGTRGLEAASTYIATRFEELQLEPGGDHGTWFQEFEATTGVLVVGENRLQISDHTLGLDTDWCPHAVSQSGTSSAPLVFAGYGITAPEYGWDDYAGLDVKGKVVVVLALEPGQRDSTSAFAGTSLTSYSDVHTKAIDAREHGAVGMLLVIGPLSGVDDRLARIRPDAGYYSSQILSGQVRAEALQAAVSGLDLESLQRRMEETKHSVSQPLDATVQWSLNLTRKRTPIRNVIALLPGRDPHRSILIAAHYDHLGMGGPSSLAPDVTAVHNGADDNASGTAALLEIARCFHARGTPPPQTLVFAAFTGEEIGLAGSEYYVDHPALPLAATTAMLNMDMVGRLRERKLIVFGVASAQELRGMLDSLNAAGPRFDLHASGDGYGPSDQMAFFKKGVPVLHFFTGTHSDYHKPSDDAPLLDYAGLAEVAGFVVRTADALVARKLTFVSASSQPAGDTGVGGFRSQLGTVPDYSQPEDLDGVLLSAVRSGSPAEQAGMRGGDVIVRIDAMPIHNIYDLVHVLKTRAPGEKIQITVMRDAKPLQVQATLAAPR